MRTFLCQIDHAGLRRFIPDHLVSEAELRRLVGILDRDSVALVRSLVSEEDAEDLRADVDAGRLAEALDLLMNRAVEITSLGAGSGIF